jgi:thiamine transport system permease protein
LSRSRITETMDKLSSAKTVKHGVYLAAVIVFFALILMPPILGIIIKWSTIQQVLNRPELVSQTLTAIANSFIIALLVSTLDVVTGVPMAWLISRGKSRWLNVLDTFSDIPFIVPTAALGYSLLLFWNGPDGISSLFGGSLVSPGWLLVLLLHFTFSYPVVVRVVVGALLDYKIEYEQASRTLGAPPFTAARTVTLSILKPSLIAAFILAFSRSISETGATIIVAGAFENGAIFIQNQLGPNKLITGPVVFASFVLISLSILMFIIIRLLGPRLKMPVRRAWPTMERKVSYSTATTSRNSMSLLIFAVFVLIPSLFVALSAITAIFGNTFTDALNRVGVWGGYWQSILLSYSLGAIVTLLNIVIGLPMAIIIARRKFGPTTSGILDIMVNIPLVVTSAALGASLKIFWTQGFPSIPQIWLLIFAHLSITYPYFVRSMSAAVERISVDLEEASRTLGAKPLGVFRTIILPLTKYSIISGAVLVFTRSISETGATLAVTNLQTAPVIIVQWVKGNLPAATIGLGCGFLILFSFIILLVLRLVVGEKGRY